MWFALSATALALIIYRKPIAKRLSIWRVINKLTG